MYSITSLMGTMRIYRTRTRARGFTLQEASLAVVIVAFGFLATMELFAACTEENRRSGQMTTAQMLATSMQELTTGMPFNDPYYATSLIGPEAGETKETYNDIDDYDGFSSNPPVDSTRAPVDELKQYTQYVTVTAIDPNRPGNNWDKAKPEIPLGQYTGAVRVRVTIYYQRAPSDPPVEVLKATWVRLDN